MAENVGSCGRDLERVSRSQDLMVVLVKDVFAGLVKTYKEHFGFEQFLRMQHEAKPVKDG
jgi:hypothetical protein